MEARNKENRRFSAVRVTTHDSRCAAGPLWEAAAHVSEANGATLWKCRQTPSLANGPMEARNKEARRDSAVRVTAHRLQMCRKALPAKGYAQSHFALTAERVAFLVTGSHKMELLNGHRWVFLARPSQMAAVVSPLPFSLSTATARSRPYWAEPTTRKPTTSFRPSGKSLLRETERQDRARLTQQPPRRTRDEPLFGPVGSVTEPLG